MNNETQTEQSPKKLVVLERVLVSNNGEHELKIKIIADFTDIPEYAEEMMYMRFVNVYR